MDTFRTPDSFCPACGRLHSACTSLMRPAEAPQPGDWTVCGYCAAVLVLEDGARSRRPTSAELDALDPEARTHLARAVAAIRLINDDRRVGSA